MILRPPRATLFPCAALFGSQRRRRRGRGAHRNGLGDGYSSAVGGGEEVVGDGAGDANGAHRGTDRSQVIDGRAQGHGAAHRDGAVVGGVVQGGSGGDGPWGNGEVLARADW